MPTGAKNFTHAVQIGSEIYHTLKKIITKEYGANGTSVGDEGGFAPDLDNEIEALDLLMKAIQESGYQNEVKIAMDSAASEFYNVEKKCYDLSFKSQSNRHLSQKSMADLYASLIEKYPIASLEDPFHEEDWETWVEFNK